MNEKFIGNLCKCNKSNVYSMMYHAFLISDDFYQMVIHEFLDLNDKFNTIYHFLIEMINLIQFYHFMI